MLRLDRQIHIPFPQKDKSEEKALPGYSEVQASEWEVEHFAAQVSAFQLGGKPLTTVSKPGKQVSVG